MQVLNHALADERQRINDADGQQHIKAGTGRIDPEVADRLRFAASDAANQSDGDGNADRCAEEIVIGEANHLGEVAHGGFTGIGLPVGVGGEGGRRVPGQQGTHAGKVLWIPGEVKLETLDEVSQQQRGEAEEQHSRPVLAPCHLFFTVNAGYAIDQVLEWAEELVFPGEDAVHVTAQRPHADEKNDKIDKKLEPAIEGHVRTSPDRAGLQPGSRAGGR